MNPCWSDSSLSSQADRPGGQCRHLYGGYQGLVFLVSSLSAIVAKCEVGGWLVSSPLWASAFWNTTLSPIIKMGLVLLLPPGWAQISPDLCTHRASPAKAIGSGMVPWPYQGLRATIALLWLLRMKFSWFLMGSNPVRRRSGVLGNNLTSLWSGTELGQTSGPGPGDVPYAPKSSYAWSHLTLEFPLI